MAGLKYSFMTFACPDAELDQVLALAREHGYDGIEPRITARHKHGIETQASRSERREIRKRFEDSGVALGCLATSTAFHQESAAARAQQIDACRRYIDLCADCGGDRIRVFGGGLKPGFSLEQASAHSREGLMELADHAEARGVLLCLETHDSHSLGATVAAIVDSIDHPFIRSAWDVQHPFSRGEDLEKSMELLKDTVAHCHMHDLVHPEQEGDYTKIVPIGEGIMPLAEILKYFLDIGFSGYISGEWWPNPGGPEETIPNFARALRRIEAGLGQ